MNNPKINNASDWYYYGVLDFLNMMSKAPEFPKDNQHDAQIDGLKRALNELRKDS